MNQEYSGIADPVDQARRAQQEMQWQAESSQAAKEFARYKQDCRKKSMEMAHADYHAGKLAGGPLAIKTAANEYYSWLTSIS